MKSVDEAIREALNEDERRLLDGVGGDMGLREMVMESFRHQSRWLLVLVIFWVLVFTGLSFYSGWQLWHATEVREMVLWAVAFVISVQVVMMLKLWHWMDLHRMSVLREIKRVELLVSLRSDQNPPGPR